MTPRIDYTCIYITAMEEEKINILILILILKIGVFGKIF